MPSNDPGLTDDTPILNRLAIIGVGLIGGSIALAARQRGLAREVIGIGRDAHRLAQAQKLGIIDSFQRPPVDLRHVDLVVVCTPVDRIAADVGMVLDASGSSTIVTDAGSTKRTIVETVAASHPGDPRYVGSHPIAGSHKSGFEHADGNLFRGRRCIVTPSATSTPAALARVEALWKGLGMVMHRMAADEHDRVLGLSSHLPHLAAAALARLVDESIVEFAGSGFRDTTRIADLDPNLWTPIFDANRDQMLQATDRLLDELRILRDLIAERNLPGLRERLAEAGRMRRRYHDVHGPAAGSSAGENGE